MNSVKHAATLAVVAIVVALAVVFVLFSPAPSYAGTSYSAGIQNGIICGCPVLVGDCICEWHPPPDK